MTATGALPDWPYWHNMRAQHPVALTRFNSSDAYPKPLVPLSQDLVVIFEEAGNRQFFEQTLRATRAVDSPDAYIVAIYGLVYFDAALIGYLGDQMPGTDRGTLLEQYHGVLRAHPDYDAPARGNKLDQARHDLAIIVRLIRAGSRNAEIVDAQRRAVAHMRPPEAASSLDLAGCRRWLDRLEGVMVDFWESLLRGTITTGAAFETVSAILTKLATGAAPDLVARLHVGLGDNESAESGRAVRTLARSARTNAQLVEAINAGASADAVRRLDSVFASQLDGVIARHGFRATPELDVARYSWRQRPELLLGHVKRELGRPDLDDPTPLIRSEAERELNRRVRPPLRRVAARLLATSRRQLSMRENCKVPIVQLFDEVRLLLEHAGPHLVARGDLAEPRDVHYLAYRELKAMLGGASGPGQAAVEDRRAQFQRCVELEPPELVLLTPAGVRELTAGDLAARGLWIVEPEVSTGSVMTGIGVSPGALTGTARVVDDPDDADEFQAGDVLIARTVDPGWSALLAAAGAIVLDVGGTLSHGAMVARELGIPCVVNVRRGTTDVGNGATVTVDGSAGTVVIAQPTART